jgi:hypothetical protein
MPWTPGDKPVKAPELAQEVMELVRDQVKSVAARIDQLELTRSKTLRDVVSDLGILADMARKVFEHLPRPAEREAEEDEPEE